jgi:putative acyl-CoA dehydrogenase
MFHQVEGGVMCPMAMTYTVVPPLRSTPAVGDEWISRLASQKYDPRDIPVEQKTGATIGMFMTEKQGGSDVRSNTTQARPLSHEDGPGAAYQLNGHKFFCSAPMSDAFMITAQSPHGISCFLVPRWRPDGTRNGLHIQRLKDKLGNKSNASAEIELVDVYGIMVGAEGRGIPTIIEMVQGNRFYCGYTSAALMRQSLVQAIHHANHREVFGKKLTEQPLMQNVLADLALESEAAISLSLRLGRAISEAPNDPAADSLARLGTAVAKYWICKRTPNYVEESIMPRIYREAPLNNIWDGSGNVMCLDVLRALNKDQSTRSLFIQELELAYGMNSLLDSAIDRLKIELSNDADEEVRARRLVEDMAKTWQAALLVQFAPESSASAFCDSRLGTQYRGAYGTLDSDANFEAIIARARAD